MANSFWTSQTPANGAAAVYGFLVNCLVAAGWSKTKDSDGTTYSSSGTQVTGSGTGTNGLQNTNAWFVVQAPAFNTITRSLCFQRGTNNQTWRIKYSPTGFSGGSPSATQVPSATDEVVVIGGGTDSSPSFSTLFGADGGYRFNGCAGDSSVGYGIYWYAFTTGNAGLGQSSILLDVLASGTYPSADTDPAVVAVMASSNNAPFQYGQWQNSSSADCPYGLYNNAGTHVFQRCPPQLVYDYVSGNVGFGASTTSGTGFGQNSWTTKDDLFPVLYGRHKGLSAPFGFKGVGTLVKYTSQQRANCDTMNVDGGTKNYIWINGCALPWDGTDPTI